MLVFLTQRRFWEKNVGFFAWVHVLLLTQCSAKNELHSLSSGGSATADKSSVPASGDKSKQVGTSDAEGAKVAAKGKSESEDSQGPDLSQLINKESVVAILPEAPTTTPIATASPGTVASPAAGSPTPN